MADPHSGKEKNELTSPAPDNLTSRELTKSGSNPAVLRDLLEIAKHDFELRQKEIELQQQQAANEHEYIKCANGRAHRGDDGTAERTPGNDAISLLGATFLGVFLILCIRMGQAQLASDAIKNLSLMLISGYSGYQYAARKFSKERD